MESSVEPATDPKRGYSTLKWGGLFIKALNPKVAAESHLQKLKHPIPLKRPKYGSGCNCLVLLGGRKQSKQLLKTIRLSIKVVWMSSKDRYLTFQVRNRNVWAQHAWRKLSQKTRGGKKKSLSKEKIFPISEILTLKSQRREKKNSKHGHSWSCLVKKNQKKEKKMCLWVCSRVSGRGRSVWSECLPLVGGHPHRPQQFQA